MTDVTTTIDLSWDLIHKHSIELASRLLIRNPELTQLVAISRGGLVPAAIVAQAKKLLFVDTLCLQSYEGRTQKDHILIKPTLLSGDGQNVLIIDDLADTGETAIWVKKRMPKAFYATLYCKPAGLPHVDLYMYAYPQTAWLKFPWECET